MPVKKKKVTPKPKKDLVVQGDQSVSGPSDMIKMAIKEGADLDKLEKLLTLQERWDANEAKKEYNSHMVAVHKNIPIVGKSLENKQTHSRYASLDNIVCKTKDIYTAEGFSISFYEGITEKPEHIRICADVIHSRGHKESYFYDVPLDGKGLKGNANMTPIHAKASSTSYGRRYLMCMIWNIPTGDDNDGNNTASPEKQTVHMSNGSDNIEDASIVKEGCISEDAAKLLVKLAQMNGYSKSEMYEIIGSLNYVRVVDVLKQDHDTLVKGFQMNSEEWRKMKAQKEKETWDE